MFVHIPRYKVSDAGNISTSERGRDSCYCLYTTPSISWSCALTHMRYLDRSSCTRTSTPWQYEYDAGFERIFFRSSPDQGAGWAGERAKPKSSNFCSG